MKKMQQIRHACDVIDYMRCYLKQQGIDIYSPSYYYVILIGPDKEIIAVRQLCKRIGNEKLPVYTVKESMQMLPTKVILTCNSTSLVPVPQDQDMLEYLIKVCEPAIKVSDYIIFSAKNYFSYKEERLIKPEEKTFTY